MRQYDIPPDIAPAEARPQADVRQGTTRPLLVPPAGPAQKAYSTAFTHLLSGVPQAQQPHPRTRRRWLRSIALLAYDAGWVLLAFYAAYCIRFGILSGVTLVGSSGFVAASLPDLIGFQAALVVGMLILLALRGMYRLRVTSTLLRQSALLFTASSMFFAGFSSYEFFFRATEYELVRDTRAIVVLCWLTAIIVPCIGRLLLAGCVALAFRLGVGRTRLVVIGTGRTGKLLMQHLAATPGLGYQVLGFLSDTPTQSDFGRFPCLGGMWECDRLLRELRAGEAIIAFPATQERLAARAIQGCERAGIPFRLVPDMPSLNLARVDIDTVAGFPSFTLRRLVAPRWQRAAKRLLDVVFAAMLLLLGLPLWLLLALLIRLDSPGPAIFRQTRIGLHGVAFTSYKFRSMHLGAETSRAHLFLASHAGRGLFKLRHDPRCTRVGRWLRRLSLDEIPQLWNVLRGDMSLVGPRPPLPDEVAHYAPWERRRLDAIPGLTGLWQVRGRSDIGFDEMVLMDIYYIENWSLRLDCAILLKTLPAVLLRRGAY